jgi:hypothetical protein
METSTTCLACGRGAMTIEDVPCMVVEESLLS